MQKHGIFGHSIFYGFGYVLRFVPTYTYIIYIIYIHMLNDKKVRQQWDVRLVISLSCLQPLHHFTSHFFIANQIVLQNISPPGQEMGQALVSNTADNAKNLSYSYCLERKIY